MHQGVKLEFALGAISLKINWTMQCTTKTLFKNLFPKPDNRRSAFVEGSFSIYYKIEIWAPPSDAGWWSDCRIIWEGAYYYLLPSNGIDFQGMQQQSLVFLHNSLLYF